MIKRPRIILITKETFKRHPIESSEHQPVWWLRSAVRGTCNCSDCQPRSGRHQCCASSRSNIITPFKKALKPNNCCHFRNILLNCFQSLGYCHFPGNKLKFVRPSWIISFEGENEPRLSTSWNDRCCSCCIVRDLAQATFLKLWALVWRHRSMITNAVQFYQMLSVLYALTLYSWSPQVTFSNHVCSTTFSHSGCIGPFLLQTHPGQVCKASNGKMPMSEHFWSSTFF